jgi:hypothetical protein
LHITTLIRHATISGTKEKEIFVTLVKTRNFRDTASTSSALEHMWVFGTVPAFEFYMGVELGR